MNILLLTHAFNSLTQRLFCELRERGHLVSIEYDIHDRVTEEAVALWQPDLVIAPYLRRAIPESVWRLTPCLVVHPGIAGDQGPSALDWAVLRGEREWGVTVLQANEVMDGGDIWAERRFPMRQASKGSLYRNEVTEAAVAAVLEAVDHATSAAFKAQPLACLRTMGKAPGELRPLMAQTARTIDWAQDDTATVLRKVRCGDGFPGVRDETLAGRPVFLYDAHAEALLKGPPGKIVARRAEAVCIGTLDGAVWITHMREAGKSCQGEAAFKLPAVQVLGEAALDGIAESPMPFDTTTETWQDIAYDESDNVGTLRFAFYNGAMSTAQCARLAAAVAEALARPSRVLILAGGDDFWSNGIHLNTIEAAESPAEESWRNINAMDDVAQRIIEADDRLVVAAMAGNAGAGGVFLALAADLVWARSGIVLNPHYKNMGNLYGSEYWTYLLPRRLGANGKTLMDGRLPILAREAEAMGLIDQTIEGSVPEFRAAVSRLAASLANAADVDARITAKRVQRARDEAAKPLADYRADELMHMQRNFFGFDPSYHVARYNFVFRVPHSWTPRHLAIHRQLPVAPLPQEQP